MKRVLPYIISAFALLFAFSSIAYAAQPAFTTFQGGTGSTSPSGILYGDGSIGLKSVTIGSNLTFSGGTLSASGGSGSPGGLNTQVQYNNAGSFGGISGATTNGTILSLTNPLLGGATLTTSSVNGVTLTTGGSATAFLNGAGSYTVPAGSGGGSGTVSTSSSETSGRIPFWTTNSATPALLSGGSPNLVWDNVNVRLGIATATPMSPLSVVGNEDHWGSYYHFGTVPTMDTLFCTTASQCLINAGSDNTLSGVEDEVQNSSSGTHAYAVYTLQNNITDGTGTHYAAVSLNGNNYNDNGFGTGFNVPNLMQIDNSDGGISFDANINATTTTNASTYRWFFGSPVTGADVMTLNTTGLGIGSSTPYGQLSINPTAANGTAPSFAVGSSTNTIFAINNAGNIAFPGILSANGSATLGLQVDSAGRTNINVQNSGTASTLNLANSSSATNASNQLGFLNSGATYAAIVGGVESATNGYLSFTTLKANVGTEVGRFTSKGLFGIGTSTPWAMLSVNPIAGNGTAPQFVVGSSSATALEVDNAGNVSIGGPNAGGFLLNVINAFKVTAGGGGTQFVASVDMAANNIARFGTLSDSGTTTPFGTFSINPVAAQGARPSLVIGSSTATSFEVSAGGFAGLGTTTPWGQLSINPVAGQGAIPDFVIGSSTKTLLSVSNAGLLTVGAASTPFTVSQAGTVNTRGFVAALSDVLDSNTANTCTGSINNSVQGGAAGDGWALSCGANVNVLNGLSTKTDLSSTQQKIFQILNTNADTGTGGTTMLQLQATESTLGSGQHYYLQIGSSTNPDLFDINRLGYVGIGTSTPYALLAINSNANQVYNPVAFAISSSTASATTTLFQVKNTGQIFAPTIGTIGSGDTLCRNTTTGEVGDAGGTTCGISNPLAKHDIRSLVASDLANFMKLNPIHYELNGSNIPQYGFNALEVNKIYPDAVELATEDVTVIGADGKPVIIKKGQPKTVDYEHMVALDTYMIQQQERALEKLGGGVLKNLTDEWQWYAIGFLAFWNLLITGFLVLRCKK